MVHVQVVAATVLLAVPTQLPPAQKLPRVELLLVVAEIASTALIEPRTTRTLARTGIAVYKATRLKFDNGAACQPLWRWEDGQIDKSVHQSLIDVHAFVV